MTACSLLPFLFSSHVTGLEIRTGGTGMGRQPYRRRGEYCNRGVPCSDAWSPIEQKWRDNICYWQELWGGLPNRNTILFDNILSWKTLCGNIFVVDLLCSHLCCRNMKFRCKGFQDLTLHKLELPLCVFLQTSLWGPMGSSEFTLRTTSP